jgi:hypothetical protein
MNEMELIELGDATSETRDASVIPELDESTGDFDKAPDVE